MSRRLSRIAANGRVKVTSLAVAVLLYAHVSTEREQEAEFLVPVRVTGLAPGLAVDAVRPSRVRLLVQSTGKDRLRMRLEPPELEVDWGRAGTGERVVETSSARVLFPVHSQARVTQILGPPTVTVVVDTLARARVPVLPVTAGRPAEGYRLVLTRTEPESVTVLGPGRAVAVLAAIETQPVDVEGRTRSFRRDVRVSTGESLAASPGRVRVTVSVARAGVRG